MMAISKLLILLVFGVFFTTACAASTPENELEPTSKEPAAEETGTPISEPDQDDQEPTPDRSIRIEASDDEELPEVAPTIESQPSTGEVPDDVMQVIMDDFAQFTGSSRASIEVVRAEAAVWSDGSLGCPKPGEVYTQSPTQGYWVVLSHNGKEYDYRATNSSYFFLCNNPPSPGSGGAPIG
jgi:hypothetical protein